MEKKFENSNKNRYLWSLIKNTCNVKRIFKVKEIIAI